MSSLIAFALLVGCDADPAEPLRFADNIDEDYDFSLREEHSGELHQPYTVGAKFELYIVHAEGSSMSSWYVTTKDYDVIQLQGQNNEQGDKVIQLEALRAGDAELEVVSVADGAVVGAVTLSVRVPDNVRLLGAGPLVVEADDAEVETPVIRTGDPGRFMVALYEGDTQLHGTLALKTWAPDGVEATIDQEWNQERREWLTITTEEDGIVPVELFIGATSIGALEVESLPKSDLGGVTLIAEEDGAKAGREVAVLARTVDYQGRDVQGVGYAWEIDGEPLDGRGDLFTYTYDPNQTQTLTALLGNFEETITIHVGADVDGPLGDVSSSSGGCSSSGGRAPAPLSQWAALFGFAAILLRGRR